MLVGSYRHIATAPTSLLKGPGEYHAFALQPTLAGRHHYGKIL